MVGKEKLIGVQYLRAIAALMVAYYHLVGEVPQFSADLSFRSIVSSAHLSSGVFIFFVISGFIMYVTGRDLSAGEFVWRRLIRIVPLYWAVTLAVCLIAVVDPRGLHRTDVTFEYVTKSVLFVPYHNPTQRGVLFPVLVPGWTLNYEMAFYALFAAALLASNRWRMWIVGAVLVAAAVTGVVRSRPAMLDISGFYTSCWLLLFAAGIGLGAIYKRLRIPRSSCVLMVCAGLVIVLWDWPTGRAENIADIIGSIAIVAGAIVWECQYGLPQWRTPLLLGDASYSIYLVHLFAFGLLRQIWRHVPMQGGAADAAGFAIASMIAAVSLALVTYYTIERPSVRWLKRIRRGALPSGPMTNPAI